MIGMLETGKYDSRSWPDKSMEAALGVCGEESKVRLTD